MTRGEGSGAGRKQQVHAKRKRIKRKPLDIYELMDEKSKLEERKKKKEKEGLQWREEEEERGFKSQPFSGTVRRDAHRPERSLFCRRLGHRPRVMDIVMTSYHVTEIESKWSETRMMEVETL